jgi:D-alanyl-D-alanine carboxypeptidase (penicillin-binding protein 5/6)
VSGYDNPAFIGAIHYAVPAMTGVLLHRRGIILTAILVILVAAAVNYLRPLPAVAAQFTENGSRSGSAAHITWPAQAQSAVGVVGGGVLAASPGQHTRPIASVTKVMTALVVLAAKPMQANGDGATLPPVTEAQYKSYQQEQAQGQSVVAIQVGEQLTELQALQGMLIPSGNDIAELLADWAYGSVGATVTKMNEKAARLGMSDSNFADVSGISSETVSTPQDLVLLGEAAMSNQVIAGVVSMPNVDLPVAGMVYSVNYILGEDGIIGIKTGSDPQAGACYLVAVGTDVDGEDETIVGATMGLPTIQEALQDGEDLMDAVRPLLTIRQIVHKGQLLGLYHAPWGATTQIVALSDLSAPTLSGTPLQERLDVEALDAPFSAGLRVGALDVGVGQPGHVTGYRVAVRTGTALAGPGHMWRLIRVG